MEDQKEEDFQKFAYSLMYKSSVGDFPLLDYPCEHWFVRYAVACEYLTECFEKIWKNKLEELRKKYSFDYFSYCGIFSVEKLTKKNMKSYLNSEIFVYSHGKEEKVERGSALWKELERYISDIDGLRWIDCPYENDYQSKCPFYKPSEFYKNTPLEELRKRKGYNINE